MLTLDHHASGRHFLQIPDPSPVPDRILRAMSLRTIDHRGSEFGVLGLKVIDGLKQVLRTRHPVAIYPASGTGAWEAAPVNVLSPGDAVLLVDTMSGLASADYRHDEWGVDVIVSGSLKCLKLPPGISFNALSPKALAASKTAKLPKAFRAWDEVVEMNKTGYCPCTPITNLLYSLHEAMNMLLSQGLETVLAHYQRWAAGVRGAVRAWGLPIRCAGPAVGSPVLTGMPPAAD